MKQNAKNPPPIDMGIKAREEIKRRKAHDRAARWKQIQEMIAWAEANLPAPLRRNRPRVRTWPPPTAARRRQG